MVELVMNLFPARAASHQRVLNTGGLLRFCRRYLTVAILLVLWQVGAQAGIIPTRLLASPVQIVHTAWSLTLDKTLPQNLLVSLGRAGAGLGSGLITASSR